MSQPAYDEEPLQAPLLAQARALMGDLPGLLTDRIRLFALELKRAAGALGQMAALGLLAAILTATAWVALWVGFAAGMIALGLAWPLAALIVFTINVAGAAWCALRVKALAPLLTLPATLRSLTEALPENERSPSESTRPEPANPAPTSAASVAGAASAAAVASGARLSKASTAAPARIGTPAPAPTVAGYWAALRKAGGAWVDDRAQSMGAALAYYTVFSIAPLLLIAISVAGLFFGQDSARDSVVAQLQGLMGKAGAEAVQAMLKSVSTPSTSIVGTVVGIVVLIIGATSVFAELQDDLNRIWQAPSKEKVAGWWAWLRTRILSMGFILAIGFLMLVSLAASAMFDAAGTWAGGLLGSEKALAEGVNFVVSYLLTAALLALIYRFMPDAHIRWRDVIVGALVTALLFVVGKFLIGLYIAKSALASGLRRRGLARGAARMGLLQRPDLPVRRRVHLGICESAGRVERRSRRHPKLGARIARVFRHSRNQDDDRGMAGGVRPSQGGGGPGRRAVPDRGPGVLEAEGREPFGRRLGGRPPKVDGRQGRPGQGERRLDRHRAHRADHGGQMSALAGGRR